jgi:hypothetical protein
MPVPFPAPGEELLEPPDQAEVAVVARGIAGAISPEGGMTDLQRVLMGALSKQMTGIPSDYDHVEPLPAAEFAQAIARRNQIYRTRIVHLMLLGSLILVPLPEDVADRVCEYANELGVDEKMITLARRYAKGSLGLALIDFNRNGYTADWKPEQSAHLHTSNALSEAWQLAVDDPALAARWADLEHCPSDSLGRRVFEFYRARGFVFPGAPGSAPPYLAQHDWVHVLADYGTQVESELEVFGLIARGIPDPKGFSLLAMVIGLFETGYLASAAGLFSYDQGHLSKTGVPDRLADAMRRGALCGCDLMAVDWFELAEKSVEDVRKQFGIGPKSEDALVAGSPGPWEPGGISPFQLEAGRTQAEVEGRAYESYGAALSG